MVNLIPMTEMDFIEYLKHAVVDYAEEKVKSGNWHPDEALMRSEKEFGSLLPEGVNTKNNYIYSIINETGEKTGMIWLNIMTKGPTKEGFIFDFMVDEQHRRKGYGEQALYEVEKKAGELGAVKLGLHVFAHNTNAIALYKKVGYEVTNLNMAKKL